LDKIPLGEVSVHLPKLGIFKAMVERLIGKRISIPGQFTGSVTVESAKVLSDTWLLRVRNQQGELHDAYLTSAEAEEILANQKQL